jgi:hypothetical protein
MRNVISSLPLSGKSLVHYYPHVKVLSFGASGRAKSCTVAETSR